MPPGRDTGEPSPITTRAVTIGLFLGLAINLVMLYNDYYLLNTPLILNHMPMAGMAVLLGLVALNPLLRRWSRSPFSSGEMLLIWCLVAISGGIGATGFARCIIGFMASPAYLATPSNEYAQYLVGPLPGWAVVSKDPDSTALRWYFEGLPRGERIPWGPWIAPLAAWTAFFVAGYCVMFALVSLLYRQWSDRERLTFPTVVVPLELAREPEPGRLVNAFLRNRVMWLGAAVPMLVFGWNGLKTYLPALPQINLHYSTWGFFTDRPWSEFNLETASVYFSMVGLTFLLTTEVSFSLWFFFVLYHLSFVWVAWLGAAGTGFFGNWGQRIGVLEASGGILLMAGFMLWSARASLTSWSRRVRAGTDLPGEDLLSPRMTAVLLAVGLAGMVLFVVAHGAQWWAAALGMLLYAAVILFLTRLVVEAGMLLIGVEAIGYEFLRDTFPASWLTPGTLTTFVQLRGGVMSDLRELLMPYLMNGIRLCAHSGRHARRLLGLFALTVGLSLIAASYARITTAYKYGAVLMDNSYNAGWQQVLYPNLVKILKTPDATAWITAGSLNLIPAGVAHVLVGAMLTLGMLVMRARFLWWPLDPIGFLVCGSWPITEIWFSVFLGWLAKSAVMTFGGTRAYRRILPFFLGLALGQAVIATVWTFVSFITGKPGILMLPN